MRSLVVLVALAAVLPAPLAARAVGTGFVLPVDGAVVARFDAPTRYGPGHRGVDIAAPSGSPVGAPAAGVVTFAGRVVDRTWVTVEHGHVRTTVGPLATTAVRRGEAVGAGAVLGTSSTAHGMAAVHWSARRGDTYLDPLSLLRAPERRVATLVPVGRRRPPVPFRDRSGDQRSLGAAPAPADGPAWPVSRVR